MSPIDYDAYLAAFNARDYDALLDYYGEEPDVRFAGYRLRGRKAIKDFYSFFHTYVLESIHYNRLIADDDTLVIEAVVRLEALADLTPQILAERGLERLYPLAKGQVVEVPQFIHYHIEKGKFVRAICSVVDSLVEEKH